MPLNANSTNITRQRPVGGFVPVHVCTIEDEFRIVQDLGLQNALQQAEKHQGLKPGIVEYIASRCGTGQS